MKLRQITLGAQELEAGPFIFLISHSIPVAYRDTRPTAMPPGRYRTDRNFSKATTRHVNTWLKNQLYATIPHSMVVQAFESVSRYAEMPVGATTAAGFPGWDGG